MAKHGLSATLCRHGLDRAGACSYHELQPQRLIVGMQSQQSTPVEQTQNYDLAQHGVQYLKLFCMQPARARILKWDYIIHSYSLPHLQGHSYGAVAYV